MSHEVAIQQAWRRSAHAGFVTERNVYSTTLDPYLGLKALADYSGLSYSRKAGTAAYRGTAVAGLPNRGADFAHIVRPAYG